ncbi:MAG: FAD-binding protein [Planctomycetales bacterium]|nr:FAD-binding protein [Planctomycetales bacterium]
MNAARSIPSELIELLGNRLTRDAAIREEHGSDESSHTSHPPDAVAFPESNEEVAEIVKICARHATPIVPFGKGSAVEGGVVAIHGGVCVDLGRMNRILSINHEDLDAYVQAGVTQFQLNEHLAETNLFFSVDPGGEATLGGMASTRASGTNTVRYGAMRENVLRLTVVLADGRIIRTSSRARKSSAGYDLTRLFVGAEGTLGIITEVTVRLYRRPDAISAAICPFNSIGDAVRTVIETIQSGIPIARVELLDEVSIDAVNRYSGLNYAATPTLFFEFQGSPTGVAEQSAFVEKIAHSNGGLAFQWATDEADRKRLWYARHQAYYAMLALRPGARSLTTDVCVPVSRLAECIGETKRELDACSLPSPLLGHVGDGNFHILFLIDPNSSEELAEAERLNRRIVERALAMDGTCTGEHGVGIGKLDFLPIEHGEAFHVMQQIKATLDPQNLMNPGKVLKHSR